MVVIWQQVEDFGAIPTEDFGAIPTQDDAEEIDLETDFDVPNRTVVKQVVPS